MTITASLVKELRERTGVGMMECKKALVETNGDIEAAAEILRKSGLAKADRNSSRIASEGLAAVAVSNNNKTAALVEVNSETDFLAKSDDFVEFSQSVAQAVLNSNPDNLEQLNNTKIGDYTVEETRQNLISKLGENMSVRRFTRIAGEVISAYSHGGKIGVLVSLEGGDQNLAHDVALHVAAMKPIAIDESGISKEALEREKEIFKAQAQKSGKPTEIIEKVVSGKIKKYLSEVTLMGQSFVRDSEQTIEELLNDKGAKITSFKRFEVGEGLEKKEENFAEEVMAQIK